jgi:hypothetical protein
MLEDQDVDEDEIEDEMGEFEPMYPEESNDMDELEED